MDNMFNSFNTIRGAYNIFSNNSTSNDSNNLLYCDIKSSLKKLIEGYIEEKKNIQIHIYQLKIDNFRLLQHIHFLDKRRNIINITHSNTTNFIIANYQQIKNVLDRLITIYNKKLDYINLYNQKIYNINITIVTLETKMNDYLLNN